MVAYSIFLFGVCLATPISAFLLRSSKPNLLEHAGSGKCSLEQDIQSELWLSHEKQLSCMPATAPGIDHVSFVTRRRKAGARKARQSPVPAQERPAKQKDSPYDEKQLPGEVAVHQMKDWGDGTGNGTLGDDCSNTCEPGFCAWCGDGAACCKKGNANDPQICHSVETFLSDAGNHECVLPPVDLQATIWGEHSAEQLVVWVSGYPRSGSSILLSMVSATVDDNREGGHTFSLFEPCHDGDEYGDYLQKRGCRQLLYGVSHCDFGGIKDLWGWRDPHSTNNHSKQFDIKQAEKMCDEADIVAFKTVDWGHNLEDWQWMLNTRDNIKVLDMVRDPRAIYGSWKKLEPFKTLVETNDFYTLGEICDHFARNLQFKDDRVKRVIFEDLMVNPKAVTQGVYNFLQQDWTDDQEAWIAGAFNAAECPPPPPGMEGFTDCHTFTGNDPRGEETWRDILNETDLALFANSANCQMVAKAYNYPSK